MRHIDLFSGIGGFALACQWVWGDEYENVGHSEIDKYACKVYHQHFKSRCLGDITKIEWGKIIADTRCERQAKCKIQTAGVEQLGEEQPIDLITGGFPCQPHSVAGKRKASGDERDLWGECVRAVRELRPRYALFENVPGLLTSERGRFFNRVLSDLASVGYDAEWTIISAASVGAPHRRERVWILAYPEDHRDRGKCRAMGEAEARPQEEDVRPLFNGGGEDGRADDVADPIGQRGCGGDGEREDVSNSNGAGLQGTQEAGDTQSQRSERNEQSARRDWWTVEPNVGRVAHGIPSRVDRLKGLGNAIVPQCAEIILRRIKDDLEGIHES